MKGILTNMKDLYWQAVQTKDARFNGAFYFAVNSTGIYCKPSCASRQPKRENVQFFATFNEAENNGFRACLRCKPHIENVTDSKIERVIKTCKYIEMNEFDNILLEDLAIEIGVNATYLQKVFKEIIGVSPKEFADANRLEKFKAGIQKGETVTNAMYDAGFGSSRALYEKASQNLGMTPATYKKGGKGMKINYSITNCKLGKMLVAATEKGISAVTFGDDERVLVENLKTEYPKAEITADGASLKNYVESILQNLAGKQKRLVLPLDLEATAFQMTVWAELRKIPFGETVSYKQVAEKLGNAKAVRAVARACATNPLAIVTPCHRVVASNGSLSGYRWGIERKKAILENEKELSVR